MKFAPQRLVAAAVIAACAATASAQTPPTPPAAGQPPSMMMRGPGMHDGAHHAERMQQHAQRRMDRFKRILQITPQQEPAFNAWANAMRPAARQRPNRDEFARMSTPERIDRMKQLRAVRMAEMDKRADATKSFYSQLTQAQQKAFDEVSLRFLAGKRGQGGGHGHHRHHG